MSRLKSASKNNFDIGSFCDLINHAIPKAVKDGRFILAEERSSDQETIGNSFVPISVPPPKGFIPSLPTLKPPRLSIPKLNVPTLLSQKKSTLAPKVGSPMAFPKLRMNEESSAERIDKFKKGVQKMLHIVKVLGKVDKYISDRTRIIVDKLAKTLTE
jgi:hypothetical protein